MSDVPVGGEPGPWGPSVGAGRAFRVLRRLVATIGVVVLVGSVAITTTGMLLVQRAEQSLTRVPVPQLDQPATPSDARHFLLVGSDSREGLEGRDLPLGSFTGQRADTMIYVAISEDRASVSLVSLPRDLLVMDGDRQIKLTEAFLGGADHLVGVIGDNFGLPINHYAHVSLGGFIDVVDTLGGVEMDIPERLVDSKSGADFEPGRQHLSAEDALAYVRSRKGDRADFERIERQQRFIRAVLSELIETRVLTDPRLLFQLVDDVASNVTTDEHLGVAEMRAVADEVRQVVRDGIPMATVPAYQPPYRINNQLMMVRYGPGAEAMFDDLRNGRPLADRGTPEDRAETRVAVYSGGSNDAGNIVGWTLQWAGFFAALGPGTASMDAGATTVVYELPGEEERARWVAAVLGAQVLPLPDDVTPPDGYHVLVAAGDDATS